MVVMLSASTQSTHYTPCVFPTGLSHQVYVASQLFLLLCILVGTVSC